MKKTQIADSAWMAEALELASSLAQKECALGDADSLIKITFSKEDLAVLIMSLMSLHHAEEEGGNANDAFIAACKKQAIRLSMVLAKRQLK